MRTKLSLMTFGLLTANHGGLAIADPPAQSHSSAATDGLDYCSAHLDGPYGFAATGSVLMSDS
jgi:hypothetical protein